MSDTLVIGGTTYNNVAGFKAMDSGDNTLTYIRPQGTKSISANGTGIDVYSYQYADVAVPNSYSASDEGKVVSNGALVAQTSDTVTANDTYDTTLINSLTVNVSGGSDEDVPLKDVVFIDYDGSIVQQYTKAEFLALSAMPSNPSHTGLTAQGWNWTLADAKTYVTNYGCLVIGQSYTTSDGKTKVYLEVTEEKLGLPFQIVLYTSVKNGVTISWGDGDSTVTTANAGAVGYYSHTYASVGNYVVTIEATSGTYEIGFNGSNTTFSGNGLQYRFVSYGIKKIELGSDVTVIHRQAFAYCEEMETISIPTSVIFQASQYSIFQENKKLKAVVFPSNANQTMLPSLSGQQSMTAVKFVSMPKSITTLTNEANFYFLMNCEKLKMLTMPEMSSLTTAVGNSNSILQNCNSIKRFILPGTYTTMPKFMFRYNYNYGGIIVVPSTVTDIGDYVWADSPAKEYHLLPTTPPSLANARSIGRIDGYTTIYVPYSADHSILNAYKTATNWSNMASLMQEEPQ